MESMYISYKRGKNGSEYATLMSSKKKDGMVMITFISSALIRMAQLRLTGTGVTFKTALLSLRNQKSRIYENATYIDEPMKKANAAYKAIGIESPAQLPSPKG